MLASIWQNNEGYLSWLVVFFSYDWCSNWHFSTSSCYLQRTYVLVCTWRNTLRSMSMNSCDIWNKATTKIRTTYFRRLKPKLWLKLSFTNTIKMTANISRAYKKLWLKLNGRLKKHCVLPSPFTLPSGQTAELPNTQAITVWSKPHPHSDQWLQEPLRGYCKW